MGHHAVALASLVMVLLPPRPAPAQADAFEVGLATLLAAPAAPPRDRAEVVRTLARAGAPALEPRHSLADIAPLDARHAAWRLAAGDDPVGLAALFASAGPDGGFGAGAGHAATALDTAEVLLSAAAAPTAPAGVSSAVGALLRTQRPDGGFAANGVDADLPTTALAVRALSAWSRHLPGVHAPRARAVAWLERAHAGAQPGLSEALRADALAAAGALTAEGVERLMRWRGATAGGSTPRAPPPHCGSWSRPPRISPSRRSTSSRSRSRRGRRPTRSFTCATTASRRRPRPSCSSRSARRARHNGSTCPSSTRERRTPSRCASRRRGGRGASPSRSASIPTGAFGSPTRATTVTRCASASDRRPPQIWRSGPIASRSTRRCQSAPDIAARLLFMTNECSFARLTEHALRPVVAHLGWPAQRRAFAGLLPALGA